MVAGKLLPAVHLNIYILNSLEPFAAIYPTLAHIVLDVLPAQASSIPCERMFSGSKQIPVDRQASLGSVVFKELVIMKSGWGPDLYDMAAWNTSQVEEVDGFDFVELLLEDADCLAWDRELKPAII